MTALAAFWRAALLWTGLVLCLSAGAALAQEADADAPEVTPPDAATLAAVEDSGDAPDIPGIDMQEWEALALRAEQAIDRQAVSNDSFEVLRSLIVEYRAQFLEAQDLHAGRIATLRTQIQALGGTDEVTAPGVEARRDALLAQLIELRAPVFAAEEAYTRANGLILEIDQIIRNRQTERLISIGPSPLNPTLWGDAIEDLGTAYARLERELHTAFTNDTQRQQMTRNAPAALVFFVLGIVLFFGGRSGAARLSDWVSARGDRGGRVWSSVVSLFQIILPLMGVIGFVLAIEILDILGTRGQLILDEVIDWALTILASLWLADRLFSEHDNQRLLPLAQSHRREARTYVATLAGLVVLHQFLQTLAAVNGFSAETSAVLGYPVLLLSSIVLFRLAQLLRRNIVFPQGDDGAPPPMRARFVGLVGRFAWIIAIVSPLLAAVGYGALADALLYPTIASLFLAGFLLVTQRFTGAFYRYVTRQDDDEEDSLISVLIAFLLVLAALPILALIWGARPADISELWTDFGEGFTIAGTRFQPTDFLVFVFVFGLFYSATRLLQSGLKNTILPKTTLDTGGRNAVVAGVGYVGIIIAAILGISATGIDLSALAFIFTALSVGIGFGLQNIVQNFVSGIILLIERPIAEGDWIEVNGTMGYVRDISVRSTRIETFDRTDVIVPNGDLISGTVTNYTRGNSIGRVIVPVGVAYGTDTKQVETILMGIAREHDMVLMNPAPSVVFQGFGADSLDFEIRAILRDVNYMLSVKSEMNHQINERFAEAGIEIPFAQRDVWLRNPEALRPEASAPEAPTEPATDLPEEPRS